MLALLARPRLLVVAVVALCLAASAVVIWRQGERIERLTGDLAVSRANEQTLESAIGSQNAAVERMAAEGRRRQSRAAEVIQRAPVARPRVVSAMQAPATGATAAERIDDIDRRFLESLR